MAPLGWRSRPAAWRTNSRMAPWMSSHRPWRAPQPEVMVNRTTRRQVVRKQFPSAAAADGVTDAIDDLASRVFGRTAARLGGWDEQLQILPLSIGEITVVRLAGFHLASVAKTSFSNALLPPPRNGQN